MIEKYSRNYPAISETEQEILASKHVLVVGCGGLGGFIIENLTRIGVGKLTVVDGDVFELSNLNRQINSNESSIGKSKAIAAKERIELVNSLVKAEAVEEFFSEENADRLVEGKDLVVDALDNVPARLLLEETCEKHGITMIHGAICGWIAQASVVRPGDRLMKKLYGGQEFNFSKTSLSFTPPYCAAVECAEAVKVLCGMESTLSGKLFTADLLSMETDLITL